MSDKKISKREIAFWFLIILIIMLGVYLIRYIQSESYECMSNPLVYGISKYNQEVTCNCYQEGSGGYIFVNNETITFIPRR